MSKQPKRFSLQRTALAYGISNLDVPERAWYEIAQFSSYKQAQIKLDQASAKTRCGTGWTHHVRLIAVEDVQMVGTHECDGYTDELGRYRSCPDYAQERVEYLWEAGKTQPLDIDTSPPHWRNGRCPNCQARDATAEGERLKIARAEQAEQAIKMLRALHGGDNRRLNVHGKTIAELAEAIPASPASVKRWLVGTAVPNLAAQAAIERLYELSCLE